MSGARTLGDWVWTIVGLAGVACIVVAIYMFIPRSEAPEDLAKLVEGHYQRGDELLSSGDAAGAVEELGRAAALVEGRNPIILNRLGEALLATGKTDEAARQWFSALSLAPLLPRPYENLAMWLGTKGDVVAAASFYRTARALYLEEMPADLDERRKKALAESAAVLAERIGKAHKDYAANPANEEALTFLLLHSLAGERVPDDADPAEGLRRAILALGASIEDLDARIARQQAACKDRQESVVDRAGLGLLLLLKGDEKAEETVDQAYELSATDSSALYGAALADLLTGSKDLSRMEQAANRMNLNPVLWLAFGGGAIANDKPDPARGALSNVLRLQPLQSALPAIPEVYRLHALTLTGKEQAEVRGKFLKAYSRFFE